MSETPRTDTMIDATGYGIAHSVMLQKRADLSRQLERENTSLKAQLAEARHLEKIEEVITE
jgi:hypothetical protein